MTADPGLTATSASSKSNASSPARASRSTGWLPCSNGPSVVPVGRRQQVTQAGDERPFRPAGPPCRASGAVSGCRSWICARAASRGSLIAAARHLVGTGCLHRSRTHAVLRDLGCTPGRQSLPRSSTSHSRRGGSSCVHHSDAWPTACHTTVRCRSPNHSSSVARETRNANYDRIAAPSLSL